MSLPTFAHAVELREGNSGGRAATVSDVLQKAPAAVVLILNRSGIPEAQPSPLFPLSSAVSDQRAASGEDRAEEHNPGVEGAVLPQQQPHRV